ncbi:MAG: Rho termination factor N-terminal domain-containing protein [Thermodesulfobacteriota bacterium]
MPTVAEIRKMAQDLNMKNYHFLRKPDLIRAVQEAEGNSPCFERIADCRQIDCLWRSECQQELDPQ